MVVRFLNIETIDIWDGYVFDGEAALDTRGNGQQHLWLLTQKMLEAPCHSQKVN